MGKHSSHLRQTIAQKAARFMVEHGIRDYASAKKHAISQMGISSNTPLPSNQEIESEKRVLLNLFHLDSQSQSLEQLQKL